MAAHWSAPYIGQPYVLGEADCARLVCRIRAEVFGAPVPDDTDVQRAASAYGRALQMAEGVTHFADRIECPAEGDVVLMTCRGRPSHVGVYCVVDGEPSVLHALASPGMVVRHRLRDLGRVRLAIEGFYRWKH